MVDVKNYALYADDNVNSQVNKIADSLAYSGSKIRIMPDGHAGKGAVVGMTATFADRICPNTVGVDACCRVSIVPVPDEFDMDKFDGVVKSRVPRGFSVRNVEAEESKTFPYENMYAWQELSEEQKNRARVSMGTLGGGNHYINVLEDDDGNKFFGIHCGSRSFGANVVRHYQDVAEGLAMKTKADVIAMYSKQIRKMHYDGNDGGIQGLVEKRNEVVGKISDKDLAYLYGSDMERYLSDMRFMATWTLRNHMTIMREVFDGMEWGEPDFDGMITCLHNYVDVDNHIIRKGAISARNGEIGLIPLNMRDGVLMVRGRGNDDWNQSLPHGAGRMMSRKKARELITMDEYNKSMSGVFSTTVNEGSIDEAPMAYKPWEEIVEAIKPNAVILHHMKEVYNCKDDTKGVM